MGGTRVVDLSGIQVVDNHCHPLERFDAPLDRRRWHSLFTESDYEVRGEHVTRDMVYLRRLTRRLAGHLGCAADEEQLLTERAARGHAAMTSDLFADAGIGGLVVDLGFPDPSVGLPMETLVPDGRYCALLRLEPLFQRLVAEHAMLEELLAQVDAELADLRGAGFGGVKSVAGYRTGLEIRPWGREEVELSFAQARAEVARTGAVRLGHKPLLDTLLLRALAKASEQELPVQFHVGYGDRDVDLRLANPLHLRHVLEAPELAGAKIVLLHGCWPYWREGAFLASVYPNTYLDISFGIPFLGRAELAATTAGALAVAPFSKVMYSSDGARVPEIFWLSAHDGRELIGSALDAMVSSGELGLDEAEKVGYRVLAGNAAEVYGLKG